MQPLEHALLTFFEQVARRHEPLLRELEKHPGFTLTPGSWRFTLPGLFSFLQRRHESLTELGYNEFRRALYATPINATIKHFGAHIVIEQNLGKVDKSVYALIWRNREDAMPTASP